MVLPYRIHMQTHSALARTWLNSLMSIGGPQDRLQYQQRAVLLVLGKQKAYQDAFVPLIDIDILRPEFCIEMQVAMYEREQKFVHSYGCVFEDCISKVPKRAIERMQPIILLGTMLGYLHKCILAYCLGHFAHLRKSWSQLMLLVRI